MDLLKQLKKQWDRLAGLILTIIGAVMLISGWVGVSGTNALSSQVPYLVSGGLGGIFLLGVGATLWISADLRDEWRKLDRIEKALAEGVLRWDDDQAALLIQDLVSDVSMQVGSMNGSRGRVDVGSDV